MYLESGATGGSCFQKAIISGQKCFLLASCAGFLPHSSAEFLLSTAKNVMDTSYVTSALILLGTSGEGKSECFKPELS